jgi:hypothetical protein
MKFERKRLLMMLKQKYQAQSTKVRFSLGVLGAAWRLGGFQWKMRNEK